MGFWVGFDTPGAILLAGLSAWMGQQNMGRHCGYYLGASSQEGVGLGSEIVTLLNSKIDDKNLKKYSP